MPKYIAKFGDRYCEWSTVVDAPVSHLMTIERFTEWYRERYGSEGMKELPQRMARVEEKGCSSQCGDTSEDLLAFNRAGKNETRVKTAKKMIAMYAED